jgi:DNA-directed RNA polymerase subunit RPC12/RpoP
MSPSNCPQCGAAIKAEPNATQYTCPYCQHSIQMQAPPPPPAAHAAAAAPQVIVVHHNTSSPVIYTGGGAWGTYWTIRLALFVVVMILSAAGYGVRRWRGRGLVTGPNMGDGLWDGTSPLTCGGNDSYDVTGINASFTAGSAIIASGNCNVTCRNCTLKAPVAVEADGNGDVKLIGGSVTGTQMACNATANGTIEVLGNATITGATHQSGNGKVTGVTQQAAAAAAPNAATTQAAAAHPAAPTVQPIHPPPHLPPPVATVPPRHR